MNLKDFSDEQLLAEIETRKGSKLEAAMPKRLENIDWSGVIRTCEKSAREHAECNDTDSDMPHYIYEEAMRAVFGKDVFERLRNVSAIAWESKE